MAKQFAQFRFYAENDERNYPSVINIDNLAIGNIFADYMPISQIGIQAIPGTKFYLNNSYLPIVIGYTGIYELDVDNLAEITSLRFDNESLNKIKNNPETYLIIDIIYEKGDNEE